MNNMELVRLRISLPKPLYMEICKLQVRTGEPLSLIVERLCNEALGGYNHGEQEEEL